MKRCVIFRLIEPTLHLCAVITILDVINTFDPFQRIKCPLGLPEHRDDLCTLYCKLDQAMADIEKALGSTTLADITVDSSNTWALISALPAR